MRTPALPTTGPIHVDCRDSFPSMAVRRVDELLRRMRGGPRVFVIRVASDRVADVLCAWAAKGGAPHEVLRTPAGAEVRIYLLPTQFGGHPATSFTERFDTPAPVQRSCEGPPLEAVGS